MDIQATFEEERDTLLLMRDIDSNSQADRTRLDRRAYTRVLRRMAEDAPELFDAACDRANETGCEVHQFAGGPWAFPLHEALEHCEPWPGLCFPYPALVAMHAEVLAGETE